MDARMETREDYKSKEEDLDTFLSKVDKIEALVKDLVTSDDPISSSSALKQADKYLKSEEGSTHTTQDRTLINTAATTTPPGEERNRSEQLAERGVSGGGADEMSQDGFLRSLEEDALERAERRREREERSRVAKKKGNEMFKKGQFDGALEHFTEAIKEAPWDLTLYTNRALTYNRLQDYDRAIEDCDTALRFEEATLKAYVHKGNALKALSRLTEAKACFKKALELFPQHSKQLNNYLKELES